VALRQGDAVGLATFGHARPRVLLPGKTVATVNTLMNAVYDLAAIAAGARLSALPARR
jgi:uncharacterized protein (DUF58 family)